MNAKAIHNLKKSLPTILKVILGIIAILYIWLVIFESQSTEVSKTVNKLNSISYTEWFGGNKEMGEQIIKSLTILIPVGFLVTAVLYATRWKEQSKFILVTGISIALSVLQFIFITGTFDLLKLINNVIGGCIGYALYCLLQKLLDKFRKKWKGTLPRRRVLSGWLCILIGLLCLLNGADVKNNEVEVDSSVQSSYVPLDTNRIENNIKIPTISVEKSDNRLIMEDAKKWDFVFQLDSVKIIDGELVLKGFTFVLGQDSEYYKKFKPEILLRTDDYSDWHVLDTEYGEERHDVNQYFSCEYDYSKSGFTATVSTSEIDMEEEYEVLIRFGSSGVSETNTFFTGIDIHYASEESFKDPETEFTDLYSIVNEGKLRLYKPDKYCWIYQYDGDLYWIAEDGFLFGINEYTHIPYELHTTQEKNLPTERKLGDFDNYDVTFEGNEITNDMDCGIYRVMKKELPIEYSISCVRTGLWIRSSNEWVWQSHLWPYYDFSKENNLF